MCFCGYIFKMTPPIFSGNDPQVITQAAQAFKNGQLVAIPTETVYGLGADADQDSACQNIFLAKGRPRSHPLIVHVSSLEAAHHYAQDIPAFAQKLLSAYWPGPLTIIVKRRPNIANAAAGEQKTIGLRCPSHPVALALLQAFEKLGGHGIAAPSANQFGKTSPTTAQHVQQAFADIAPQPLAMIVDGGTCDVGIESTIIDCSNNDHMVLLRPGILTIEELEKTAGVPLAIASGEDKDLPNAPGTLPSHYAPNAKVRLMSSEEIKIALGVMSSVVPANPIRIGVYARNLTDKQKLAHIITHPMPDNAKDVAHELFSVLHNFDAQNVNFIWIEKPPKEPEWIGVLDRLEKAAAA